NWVAERLRRLAHQTLRRSYPRVARWELTDDVLQGVLLRLWKSLGSCRLQSPLEFFKLATQHLRWELIDLARHHYGPEGVGANHASQGNRGDSRPLTCEQADHSHEPSALAEWTEFHQKVEQLPAQERVVFDLLWYQVLSRGEVANLLGRTEQRVGQIWQKARVRLNEALGGRWPGA